MAGMLDSVSSEMMTRPTALRARFSHLRCALCSPRQDWYYGGAVQSRDGNVFCRRSDGGFDDGCRHPEGSWRSYRVKL